MKKILITGATSGIGRGLAEYYALNDEVFACGRNKDALLELSRLPKVTALQFDVTDLGSIQDATGNLPALDILILNAGNCEYIDDAKAFDSALFERIIQVNLVSIGYCLEQLLPKVKSGGQLVIVSSSAAFLALPRAQAYGASKAAVSYLAQSLSIDLTDIDVTLVHPGFVKTPLTDKNDFPMPMAVTVDKAVACITAGIIKRRKDIHFPKRLTIIMKLLQMLPFGLWRPIAKGISR
ncbi:SDR family NAD(P)-dependent oxidoreductase [Pseudoalteromonas aurantia]|uniref:Short-chain dehydrogenase n=1 Tax=Pseudoalteromonas aurantia 208 TaxID=1314867 RepID=A0ABR9EGD5_9GAMM|nr:SDR family NAD(P)-dependent oxidoreductase [Pseudoalteromonas aurantia]MBE0370060.1 hypothetical protein [Pseudoalteromonas aurantia 208]